MAKRIRPLLLVILLAAAMIVGGAGLALASGDGVRAWAFDMTGETALGGQVRGLLQLPLNLLHRPLRLAVDVPTNYGGVNPFGVNTFLHQEVEEAKREEQLRLIKAAGFYWLRQEFPWEDIEVHARGDFVDRRNDPAGVDAWAKYDHIVDLTEQYDLELIVRLSNPPKWSRALGDEIGTNAPPDDYDDYANFAAAVAERYRGRIRYYQLWNEPNIYPEWGELTVSPENYTDLLCRAARAIREVDPDAVILSGALAPTIELNERNFNDYLFLQRMYDAGAAECFDILSMQGYGLWSGPTDRRVRPLNVNYARPLLIRDIMVRNGDAEKAIWISEMNWNVAPDDVEPRYGRVTLEEQAEFAPLAYQRAQAEWPWVGVVNFWYFKRAESTWLDEKRPEAYFQMSDPEFNLLPVYDSMAAYANQPPVVYEGVHWPDHWAITPAGWQPSGEGHALAAGEDAGPLRFTFDGNALGVVWAGGGLTLSVDGGPAEPLEARRLVAWQGERGPHTAEIMPQGEGVVVETITVWDQPRRNALWMVIGLVIMVGAWVVGRRIAAPDGGDV